MNELEKVKDLIAENSYNEAKKELTKYIRGERDFTGVEEEMADVYIALGLIKKMLNIPQEEIDKITSVKISRHLMENARNNIDKKED